jgi:hypothetical protein
MKEREFEAEQKGPSKRAWLLFDSIAAGLTTENKASHHSLKLDLK